MTTTGGTSPFEPGALVHARGRDWVVQPDSTHDFLVLRPIGGRSEETTGVYLPLEGHDVRSATFDLPGPDDLGDARSASLLRDAARLTARATTGPFRSFGRIAVSPRPYQLVPLLMALKLEPVRLLIADDVGIGKTIEAALVARELLDRGEVERLAVLCPPHLAEQWQSELRERFHLDAELVLPSTVRRLERGLRPGESLFERHPITIVSLDYIKGDRHRQEFLRAAPELVIVDEAHTCAEPGRASSSQHQRHQLLRDLAKRASRHLILVTATPHSGNEDAFRSLLALLKPEFARLPDDLSGRENEQHRRELAQHFVQRKRGDIHRYLDSETPFPTREDDDLPYTLSGPYKQLFDKVLAYARETLQASDGTHRQRVRWWAMLGLLRALASSPAAAASTLRNRAVTADTSDAAEADDIGRRIVLDVTDDESAEGIDVAPGAHDTSDENDTHRRRLLTYAREADALAGAYDTKLQVVTSRVRELIDDGYAPIVFCRFIPTAEYVADHLRSALKNTDVAAVTGLLAPDERQARVAALGDAEQRVLVATDCLSEGINLQERFDAVVHYDLSWNPTRHEQRDGRVDRYGQRRDHVRITTVYGTDNQIDGVVLDVLLRKHQTIRTSLGISVPVPTNTDQVIEAIFEGLLLRGLNRPTAHQQALFDDLDAYIKPQASAFQKQWDAAVDRERRSRTVFAQERLDPDEVANEYRAAQAALGSEALLERFLHRVVPAHGGTIAPGRGGDLRIDLSEAPDALRDALPRTTFTARTDGTQSQHAKALRLTRTHPITEALASFVLDAALDPHTNSSAARAGVMRTSAVTVRTVLLLARFRYHLVTTRGSERWETIAEDTLPLAFTGTPDVAHWLDEQATTNLLEATPSGNVDPGQARHTLQRVLEHAKPLTEQLESVAYDRAERLLSAHRRVRTAADAKGLRYAVNPLLPADVLGAYVFLPA
jgi:superfamily II DNA or RNA helicase